jgi:hypothetical protein
MFVVSLIIRCSVTDLAAYRIVIFLSIAMHFLKPILVAGFLFSTTLAAPLLPVEAHELEAREYDIDLDHAARGWSVEEAIAARELSEHLDELMDREEEYLDFLVARNKWLEAAKKIRTGLKTKSGEAVFWSGNTPRPGQKPISAGTIAKKFAESKGKSTLQMKLNQEGIKIPPINRKDPNNRSEQLWRMASKRYASKANGPVNAFVGQNLNPNGVYSKYEKPRLLKNPAVSKLIESVVK